MSIDNLVFLSAVTVGELSVRCIYALLLFVPVLICCLLLGQRRPYLQLTLWSLVVIRLLLPSSFNLPFSIRELLMPMGDAPLAAMGGMKCIMSSLCLDVPILIPGISHQLSLTVMAIGWVCGAAWLLGRFISNRRFYEAIVHAAPVTKQPELIRAVAHWRAKLGVRRHVQLHSGDAALPFTKGIWRPRIYLPRTIAQDTAVSDVVIGHEMAHIKRYDDLSVCVCGVAKALFFFFPPIRYALKQIDLQRERVCDQLVVVRGRVDARDYARHLLTACNDVGVRGHSVPGLSAHAAVYSSRIAAIAEAATLGIRGIPLALLLLVAALVFVMPMAPNLPARPHASMPAQVSTVQFKAPLAHYEIGSRFAEIRHMPAIGGQQIHTGLDLRAPANSSIVAMADGVVVKRVDSQTNSNRGYGNYLLISHGEYLVSYTDLVDLQVSEGTRVYQGQMLGRLDKSAHRPVHTRPRLHLEVIKDGVSIDPLPLLGQSASH